MSAPSPTHTGLFNGALIDLAAPDWRDLDLAAIGVQLSRLPRFLGATTRPVSVLEHSLAVARIVSPRLRLAALIHDAHEALMCDLTRPVRKALEAECGSAFTGGLSRLTGRLDFAIAMQVLTLAPEEFAGERGGDAHKALALRLMKDLASPELRVADDAMCQTEMRVFTLWGAASAPLRWSAPPDADALLREWHDALEFLVARKLGAPCREMEAVADEWGRA